MPVERPTGRAEAATYSKPSPDPAARYDRCSFIGASGQCGLRGNIRMGGRFVCTFHDERMSTRPGRIEVVSNGTFVEFHSWRQQKIDEGDARWEKHDADWWWKRITGEECP